MSDLKSLHDSEQIKLPKQNLHGNQYKKSKMNPEKQDCLGVVHFGISTINIAFLTRESNFFTDKVNVTYIEQNNALIIL